MDKRTLLFDLTVIEENCKKVEVALGIIRYRLEEMEQIMNWESE